MICDYRLKVFYTVAVKGSFTAAAKELGITQPAVSNHISELECAVGDTLFQRSRKETVLTEKGHILFDYAEKILYLYKCADRELVPRKREDMCRLCIAAVPEAARFILKPIIENYSRLYPDVEISVLERSREEAMLMLDDAEADIAVTDIPWNDSDTSIFATISINGAAAPMTTYYMSRTTDSGKSKIINDFLLCCKTFK